MDEVGDFTRRWQFLAKQHSAGRCQIPIQIKRISHTYGYYASQVRFIILKIHP